MKTRLHMPDLGTRFKMLGGAVRALFTGKMVIETGPLHPPGPPEPAPDTYWQFDRTASAWHEMSPGARAAVQKSIAAAEQAMAAAGNAMDEAGRTMNQLFKEKKQ